MKLFKDKKWMKYHNRFFTFLLKVEEHSENCPWNIQRQKKDIKKKITNWKKEKKLW